jgi:hypothetical protein
MDGIPKSNRRMKRVEPLIGVRELKERYLFGIVIKDDNGNEIPEKTYQSYINTAVSMLENHLDIAIFETDNSDEPEFRDFYRNEYQGWGSIMLNNIPVIEIKNLDFVYQKQEDETYATALEIPKAWIRLDKHSGIIRLVPNANFPSQLSVGASGAYYPDLFARYSHLPNMWRIKYSYGFESGKVPILVNTAIGLIAACLALMTAGDLVIGSGIASKSLGLDSLSESISTTASPENSAFSARIKEYQRLLYGPSVNSPERGILRQLFDYFQGSPMQSI